ncbi:unnamed protein product [Soboliphyme baturini]|uniref:DUF4457 domain-containing protein n=1 Tax=Soboliphyme baturini TaxID=241478 RepID=A0A183IUR9_9BILA|nr:unnamed protein product [Soboliphyme baturini]
MLLTATVGLASNVNSGVKVNTVIIDDSHLLIIGGCGGANLIFSDIWLLSMLPNSTWLWEEVTVINASASAPQLWSHPACKVGDNVVVVSKAQSMSVDTVERHRSMSSSTHLGERRLHNWVPPQGNLIPPRRKLIISRSFEDRQDETSSSGSDVEGSCNLYRTQSFPAVLSDAIPKIVVIADTNRTKAEFQTSNNEIPKLQLYDDARAKATSIVNGRSVLPDMPGTSWQGYPLSRTAPLNAIRDDGLVKVKHMERHKNRQKQLDALRRMELYIRARLAEQESEKAVVADAAATVTSSFGFRPNCSSSKSSSDFLPTRRASSMTSRNPMSVYFLDIGRVLSDKQATWSCLPGDSVTPQDTLLYSLVKGRGELIMFGGMRTQLESDGQLLDMTPSYYHTITNDLYLLKPVIKL